MPKSITQDEVQKRLRDISLSLEWRKPKEQVWDRIIDYLKGMYYDDVSEMDRICVNMVHPHVRIVIPAIYSRNPDVIVSMGKFEDNISDLDKKRAEIMQRVIRYDIKELGLKEEVKLCLLDAILTGMAWVKTGYETEFIEDKKDKEPIISKLLKSLNLKDSDNEEEFQPNEKIGSERPWVLRTSPYDIIVPMLSRRPEELSWITERSLVPYDYVLNNPDYHTTGLKPSTNANKLLASLRGSKGKNITMGKDLEYCILYEIWDGPTAQVITLCDGYREALQVKDSEYTFLDSRYHPYVSLRFNEILDEFYPVSDIEPAEPQLLELNDIRTQQNHHRKRYNRRYTSRPGALSPEAKTALKAGEDGTIVELAETFDDKPLQDIIAPLMDAPLPAEIYAVESRIKDDIYTILGTSDYASQASGGARTATEASIIATQSRFRVEERIDLVGMFVQRIIRNLAMLRQKFTDKDIISRIVGKDAMYWKQLDDDNEIRGEFLFNVIYASSAPINREVDREQFMKFFMLAKNDPYYDQTKLRLQLARKFDLDNPEGWLDSKIAQELTLQREKAVKLGMLLEGPANPLSALGTPSGSSDLGTGETLPTGQPRGLPGDLGGPSVPGGRGGTALADAGV